MAISVRREGDRWVARFPFDYATKDVVKAAGFRFDAAAKLWWTDKPEIAARFSGGTAEAVAAINREREAAQARQEASVAASRASASAFEVPRSAACMRRGLDFLPYQKAGIEFCTQRRDSLVADEMGLGKTMQALGLVNCDPSVANVLIVCPASLKLNWQREAQLWLSRDLPVSIANGSIASKGVVIINYEMVGKARAAIDQVRWDLLICDESHFLKNPKAQRTSNVLGKWDRDPSRRIFPIMARRRVFLTGTPILNRPKELWTLLHALDPQGLGNNWQRFHTRYCAGHKDRRGHWDIDGASNLEELQGRLRASLMVRRLKSEVLTELPAKRRQIIVFRAETSEEKAAIAAEQKFVADTEARLAALRAALESLSDDEASEAYRAAADELREAQAVAFTETSKVRHQVALAKLPQVIEHVRDCLEAVPKIVLWAHHHDVIDALTDVLGPEIARRADGRDSIQARDAAVQAFQSDPALRVLVCGIAAMGTGHTMTAAAHAIFAELDWVPGNLAQAEDRCHRIGQRDAVLVQHLVLDGSMDARMCQMIVDKMGVISAAVDDGGRLPAVEKLAEPVEPEDLRHAPGAPRGPATAPPRSAAPEMPEPQRQAVHAALRLLAGMCDGAYALDGAGFNKLDTGFGHDLAAQDSLSPRQAAAARRMVLKYVRQIPGPLYAVIKGEEG